MSTTSAIVYDPVAAALLPKSRRAVLGLLYGQADQAFYLRQIVDLTGLGVGHVQRELRRLTEAGLVRRTLQGRHVFFQADARCPVYAELRGLVRKTMGAATVLKHCLEPLRPRITAAFVYGSVARGEERSASDLDLMIVGDVTLAAVVRALRPAHAEIRREFNPTVYPPSEFRAKLAAGSHFLHNVMRRPKVFLWGSEHELGPIPAERLDPPAPDVRRRDS